MQDVTRENIETLRARFVRDIGDADRDRDRTLAYEWAERSNRALHGDEKAWLLCVKVIRAMRHYYRIY